MHSKHWPTQPNSSWINLLPSSIFSFPLANSMLCTAVLALAELKEDAVTLFGVGGGE